MPGYEPSATSRKASATGTRAACGRASGAATLATITEKVGAWCSQPAMPLPAPSDGVMIDAARKRTKASRVPSGLQTGQRSESIDGASQRTRRSPRVYSPMKLWSSSWSSKVISDKTLAMNAAIDELEEAVASLAIAAAGKDKDTGFLSFLGGQKTLDEGSRQKLAQAAYKKGTSAFNKYILIGNDGLGLSFAPLEVID